MNKQDDVRNLLEDAEREFALGCPEDSDAVAEKHLRLAYYKLYLAVKLANMQFNARKRKGYWSEGGSYTWIKEELDSYTEILYRRFYRDGKLPQGEPRVEFMRWRDRCLEYISKSVIQARTEWNA